MRDDYYDEVQMMKKPQEKLTIKNTAIPTIIPNCLSYMTYNTERPKRLSFTNNEEEMLQKALMMSRIDDNATVVKFLVIYSDELVNNINPLDLENGLDFP